MTKVFNEKLVAQGGVRIPAGAAAGLFAQADSAGNISWVSGTPGPAGPTGPAGPAGASGTPPTFHDDFSTNNYGQYSRVDHAGGSTASPSTWVSNGSVITPPAAAADVSWSPTALASLCDSTQVVKFVPGLTTSNNAIGFVVRYQDSQNHLLVQWNIINPGANITMYQYLNGVLTVVGGSGTNYAPVAATTYWMKARINGLVLTFELYTTDPESSVTVSPVASLSASVSAIWTNRVGKVGLFVSALASDTWQIDDYFVRQFTPAIMASQSYQKFTATGTFVVPAGVTKLRVRAIGGGGGGGGAGAATGATLQGGAGGGAAGTVIESEVTVAAGDSLAVTIGTGGNGGLGGTAPGGAGAAGTTAATATTVVNSTASANLVTADRGRSGGGGAGNSTGNGPAGLYGVNTTTATVAGLWAGSGGAGGNSAPSPMLCVVGGSGGGAATATLGGGGGGAQLSSAQLAIPAVGAGGASGTAVGVAGVTATLPGCGGGGGGGGAAGTGAGGAGGSGANGQVEIWW